MVQERSREKKMTIQARARFLKLGIRPLVLWGAVAVIGWFAQLPRLSPEESAGIAGRFHFQRERFPRIDGPSRSYRNVNPRLQRINAWISTVGAGIALGDLDGDGLSNDACLVDPRTDDVIVTPVPGTGERYRPFALSPYPLPYDSSSMAPMGCLLADLNEDGLRDVVVYYWGRTPVAFLRRSAAQTTPLSAASFVPQELVPGGERWYTNAGLAADIDGDGHADLIFGNYFADGSMVLGNSGPVEMQASMSRAGNGGSKPVLLWKSATTGEKPSVQFSRAANLDSALGHGWTLAMAACDIDGDLLPDIYIANDYGPDVLLHNVSVPGHVAFQRLRGHRELTTPKSKVLGQDSFKGMGVDCADLNGDGLPDFMVGNITDSYALEESNLLFMSTGDLKVMQSGVAPYRERGESLGLARSGWSWDVRFGDFDNDGFPEIVQATGFLKGSRNRWPELQELAMGNDLMQRDPAHWPRFGPGDDLSGDNRDRFYVRSRSGRYFDLAPLVGLGEPYMTRGVAVADVDGDGRLDFVLANQWADSFVFHNLSESTGDFLGLHVLLPVIPASTTIRDGHTAGSMRGYPALGTRVTVYLPDGRKLVQQVDGGNGHSGKSSPDLHFGLGAVGRRNLRVAFDWRDRNGTVRHEDADLAPGWHTVLLGSSDK
jgi:enediyne biosynthesis protein E4